MEKKILKKILVVVQMVMHFLVCTSWFYDSHFIIFISANSEPSLFLMKIEGKLQQFISVQRPPGGCMSFSKIQISKYDRFSLYKINQYLQNIFLGEKSCFFIFSSGYHSSDILLSETENFSQINNEPKVVRSDKNV